MDTPFYASKQYLSSALLATNDALLSKSVVNAISALCGNGFIEYETLVLTTSGLVVTANFGTDFIAIFNSANGVGLSQAHGTTANEDTQTYSIDLTSLVPATAGVVVYLYLTYFSLGMAPITIVGPPSGHPNYDPTFVPYTSNTYNRDSFSLSAGTSIPAGSLEIARTALSPGQSVITSLDQSHAIKSSSYTRPNFATDTGAVNALVVALNDGNPASYPNGTIVKVRALHTNTGTSTLTVGAVTYTINQAGLALTGGEIVVGWDYEFIVHGGVVELVGSGAGSVNVANATGASQAVNLGQAQADFAAINGNATKNFSAGELLTTNVYAGTSALLLLSNANVSAVNDANSGYISIWCAPATVSQGAVTLGQAQAGFAAITGSTAHAFSIANATTSTQAVSLGQAQADFAALNGSTGQTFATSQVQTGSVYAGNAVLYLATNDYVGVINYNNTAYMPLQCAGLTPYNQYAAVVLSNFPSSFGTNGWKKYPDPNSPTGYFIEQWAQASIVGSNVTNVVNWPIGFPTGILTADVVFLAGNVPLDAGALGITPSNGSQGVIQTTHTSGSGTLGVLYKAKGY